MQTTSGGHVQVAQTGGPEVLVWRERELPAPAPGEALIAHEAVGLNFIDVYFRTGLYPAPSLPFTPGQEAAGTVLAVGDDVSEVAVGQRVAYTGVMGSYATHALVPAERLVPLPDGLDSRTAAAVLLKGLTAEYLVRRTHRVEAGQTVLVHAAAGGVGLLLCQWCKLLGVRVIGTAGSEAKAALARDSGCAHTILYRSEDVVSRVRELTHGAGVPVVYDSVGRDTFQQSLDCLAPRGLLVSFGQSSGKVPPLDVTELSRKGSLYLTRPTLNTYVATRAELLEASAALFQPLLSGALRVRVGQTFPLREAAEAHRALEGRATRGSTLLLP